jgi:hypothetical protein
MGDQRWLRPETDRMAYRPLTSLASNKNSRRTVHDFAVSPHITCACMWLAANSFARVRPQSNLAGIVIGLTTLKNNHDLGLGMSLTMVADDKKKSEDERNSQKP